MSDAIGPYATPEGQRMELDTPPVEAIGVRDARWWGALELPIGGLARWRAGPSSVTAERRQSDWRIWHDMGDDAYAAIGERIERIDEEAPAGAPTLRFSFGQTPETIRVLPALPDRQVVVRPESTVSVSPGEKVTLYASTPVWMAFEVEVTRRRRGRGASESVAPVVLSERPTARPTDTWFGPNTREGELCYAVRTAARMSVDDLPLRPHRAVIPITLENNGLNPMILTRVAVPMPYLTLYVDHQGRLWSGAVRFVREPDDDTRIRIDGGAPSDAIGAVELAGPRHSGTFGAGLGQSLSRLLRGEVR
jgi:hypothetical protein